MRIRSILAAAVCSSLLGLSPLAADSPIPRGIDIFTTQATGTTFYDFARNPIPAGFFCADSQAFTGRVAFKGLPLATEIPGQLSNADTVIERLDDAVFDGKGRASTRIRFRALSLVSLEPMKTACGDFHVYVSLAGKQRVTSMSLSRTDKRGGSFVAPLAVDARMTFLPVEASGIKDGKKRQLAASFTFPASSLPWSLGAGAMAKRSGTVKVDTDGDLIPDTRLPGTSSFSPGLRPDHPMQKGIGGFGNCPCYPLPEQCHVYTAEKEHCYTPAWPNDCVMNECHGEIPI